MDEFEVQPGGVGWKLHLAVPEENQDLVEAGIKGMGITPDTETPRGEHSYKRGRASGQEGKEFTVYAGHRDDADLLAGEIDTQMGHLLTSADAVKSDTPMAGNVVGRFDAQAGVGGPQITVSSEMPGMDSTIGKYSNYGSGGVPYLDADKRAQFGASTRPFDQGAAEARAIEELTKDYGEAFTGSPPAQETGGGGGGGGGGASAPAGEGGSSDFDVRMIFQLVDEAVGEKAEELKAMSMIEAPFLSGDLRKSHEVVRHAPASYTVQATESYAKDVHEGHDVTNKKGGEVFRHVDGNPWMTRAINNLAE